MHEIFANLAIFGEFANIFCTRILLVKLRTSSIHRFAKFSCREPAFLGYYCLVPDFAKLTCREIFLFYSTLLALG